LFFFVFFFVFFFFSVIPLLEISVVLSVKDFSKSRVFVAVLSFCFSSKSLSRMRVGKTKRRALLLSI